MKLEEFEHFEKQVRSLVGQNKLKETINLMGAFFTESSDLNEITIQSSNYYSVLEKQRAGTANSLEVDLALNKLRSNILQLLSSKKEYLKYKSKTFGDSEESVETGTGEIKVFFSVGSPHNDQQQIYIDNLVKYFQSNGIRLVTLKKWNDNDPIVPIIDELKESNGCFVLALERYFVNVGTEKRGSDQENKILEKSFTSPWLHIEAAIARSLDLPLIIFKDKLLNNEGLIHDDKQEWGIVRIDETNMEEIHEYPVKNFILSWINQVKKYSQNKNGNQ